MPTDDPTLRRVADELAIRNLIARLAQLADGGDLDEYVSLFTQDASWNMPGAPRHGRSDIAQGAHERRSSGTTGPGSNTRHVITTVRVDADGGDTATAQSYWHFYGNTVESPTLQLAGVYDDTFVRQPEGWKLATREITFG